MSIAFWCLVGFSLGFASVAASVAVQAIRRHGMGVPGKALGSFSGLYNHWSGGGGGGAGGGAGSLLASVSVNAVGPALSKREASAEVSLWADLAERTDASLTSPTPDYDAIDQTLKSFGIEHGSMMDPIALMHAMPKPTTIHLSSLPEFPGMIRVSVHESGSQQSSRRVDNAVHGIAACLAELEFIKASSRVNGVAQGLQGVSSSGSSLSHQYLQQMLNLQGQQQATRQSSKLRLYGQLFGVPIKPPGSI
jgi:hypothetical protein